MKCTCRVLTPPASNLEWMKTLGINNGLVSQEIRLYAPAGGRRAATIPVRCIVASKNIVRGERICVTPPHCVVTGNQADSLIREICDRAQRVSLLLPSYTKLMSSIYEIDKGAPELLLTRDGLLLTLLLFLLRSPRYAGLLPPDHALRGWAHRLPPRAPPLGLLLRQHHDDSRAHMSPSRRLVLRRGLTADLPPTADLTGAAAALMTAAVEAGGLGALRTPHVEVAVTERLLSDFYKGRPTALTQRQHEAAVAHALRQGNTASLRHLLRTDSRLHEELVLPLLRALGGDEPAAAEDVECLGWAHFMTRSRVMNANWRRGPPQMALVPFLDCLNHSHVGANVVYFQNPFDGAVVVTASRPIAAGEELLMHYGNYGQRGCLFGDASPSWDTAAEDLSHMKSGRVSPRAKAAAQEVRAIEAKQKREVQGDEDTNDALNETRIFDPARSVSVAQSDLSQAKLAQHEALIEATWLWRYGFIRSDAEKSYEASQRWNSRLRNRIANLTDVRRKGRPGEFVIGVPEGLEYLRAQREALERERYHNTRIFPPQQA